MRARIINENVIFISQEEDDGEIPFDDLKFFVDKKNQEFQLFMGEEVTSESGYCIEHKDEWFDEKYLTLHELRTFIKFQGNGLAKCLLNCIFNYVKDELDINIITLIVFKDNIKAIKLYQKCGFEVYENYDDSYCLVKYL
jgi:ribosomal protein S18 acetylase RimI-like enzyme